jgi:hypothetical protein
MRGATTNDIRCGRVRVLIEVGQAYMAVEAFLTSPQDSTHEYVRVFCDADRHNLGLAGSLALPQAYLQHHTVEAVQAYLGKLRSEVMQHNKKKTPAAR